VSVTIDPGPCGRIANPDAGLGFQWACSEEMRCGRCEKLGSSLAYAQYNAYEYIHVWWFVLAANLTLASLLCSAEQRGRDKESAEREAACREIMRSWLGE
jgi:hypothetical protein